MAITLKSALVKTIGAGGLSLGLYDAHCQGKRSSIREGKIHMANNTLDAWMNSTRLEAESDVEMAMRKEARNWLLDSPIPKITGNIKGYVQGVFNSIADNVVPITLSAGTIISKSGGLMSKLSFAGLSVYAVYKLIRSFTPSARSRQTPY